MNDKDYGAWMRAGIDAWSLGVESSLVVGLRMAKFATGGDPLGHEARRMVSEKVESAIELQTALVTGALGTTPLAQAGGVMRHYKRKVSANRRRLGR